ncbi:type IV pilin N-term methylation site GFxxxE [Exiguobacterium indicum]|uniref:Type IV pilin N-term methylation site GFxxxE n=1 Tax=Exiguobacterium indicum TaxID=296995 RepID=A0A0V8GJG0_9BACL|nr:prepilin-type N-terminal cleavage/methylation domain-containing protein [Exiguobacterium enclense]KSU50414.1 type IV pilin N-term methylation site GFxxxE [Exiguobacterium enclense]SDB93720.1 type IV pilus assembly protein PilA [Exiguobacterium enclense]
MIERLKEIWLDAKQMRDERGLTLIELLVVVVILGIIAAIAVVAIGGLIENSRKDAVVSDAKQLVSAAKLYASSNPIQAGETVKLGLYRSNSAFVPATGEVKIDKYIDSMEDPFNTPNKYKEAFVEVTESNGSYSYKVTLKGKNAYFNDAAPSTLKRSDLSMTAYSVSAP